MMQKVNVIVFSFLFAILAVVCVLANNEGCGYSVIIQSFTINGSYVEYPQIVELENKEKQAHINNLLEKQVYVGAKNYLYEPLVDLLKVNDVYNYKAGVRFTSPDIASFWYSVHAYGETDDGHLWDTVRFYGVTVNMNTGEAIKLNDLIVIDERLFDITDGSNFEIVYNSLAQHEFHNLKDLFGVYTSEDEKDSYHFFLFKK